MFSLFGFVAGREKMLLFASERREHEVGANASLAPSVGAALLSRSRTPRDRREKAHHRAKRDSENSGKLLQESWRRPRLIEPSAMLGHAA
jgi:hypothetical protein